MALLYTNENFPLDAVEQLRILGYDVVTTHEAGRSNQGLDDEDVLRFATESGRCVATLNRKDFIRLHRSTSEHAGMSYARRTGITALLHGALTLQSVAPRT